MIYYGHDYAKLICQRAGKLFGMAATSAVSVAIIGYLLTI